MTSTWWARALAPAALAAAAAAQCVHVPDDTPTTGACSVVPFGSEVQSPFWANQRYQTLVTAAELGAAADITSLGFATCATSTAQFQCASISIALAPVFGGTLSTTFDQNLAAGSTEVFRAQSWTWPVRAGGWNEIVFQQPFPYDPNSGDVVVDITIQGGGLVGSNDFGMRAHTGRQRVFAVGFTGTPPAVAPFDDMRALKMRVCLDDPRFETGGTGCPATLPLTLSYGGRAGYGEKFQVVVSNGQSGSAGVVALGGAIAPPYPIDLAPLGLGNCSLWLPLDLTLGIAFRGGSTAVLDLTMTAPGVAYGVEFYNQALAVDTRVPAGLTTSNWGRVVAGAP